MDVKQFLTELHSAISNLDFVEAYTIEQFSVTYIKINFTLKPRGILSVWFNAIKRTQSFSIILDNARMYGYDFDNRVGWHEHPLENPNLHVAAEKKTIQEIVDKIHQVYIGLK